MGDKLIDIVPMFDGVLIRTVNNPSGMLVDFEDLEVATVPFRLSEEKNADTGN